MVLRQDSDGSAHQDTIRPLELSNQERAIIAQRSRTGIYRALLAQFFTGASVILIAWIFFGNNAAASALIGAAAYFIPNAIFALRLLLGYMGPKRPGSLAFFWGELFKLATAGLIVTLVAWQWGDWLNWLAFLLGLLGVMKGYVVLLALRRMP